MKILILGGTGVLSTDILNECLKYDNQIYIVNRGHTQIPQKNNIKCHFIVGDIRIPYDIRNKIKDIKFDVIIDFLSYNKEQLTSTWEALSEFGKQYIFISSCCVFRRAMKDGIISENSPKPNPNLLYSINKYECENLIKKLSSKSNTTYTIVRPYITYGNTRIPFGIAPQNNKKHGTLIARIRAGKPMFLWDDGLTQCSILHTKDFAKIFYKILNNPNTFNQDINLTSEKVYTWKEVAECIFKKLNQPPLLVYMERNKLAKLMPTYASSIIGDRSLNAIFSHDKLYTIIPESRNILNESISLSEGLQDTITNYDQNNNLLGIDYIYDAIVDRAIYNGTTNKELRKKLSFINYSGDNKKWNMYTYMIYRYLPYNIANKVYRIFSKLYPH